MKQNIVFFDDICVLCSWAVRFIFKHDTDKKFYFASFQSDAFTQIKHKVPGGEVFPSSVVYYSRGKIYNRSTAALRIAGQLRFPVSIFFPLLIIPRFIRDWVYDIVAKNRYRWFGKRESCYLPDADMKVRYLG